MKDNLEIWDDIFKSKEWGKYPAVPLIKFIAINYYKNNPRKDIKILELGSGTGANLWYVAREGFTVYGVEGSQTARNICVKRLEDENLKAQIGEIISGDYLKLLDHFEDDFFDAVIDVESLYCNSFEKSREIVEKSFRKLKSGGRMFSFTFADGTWGIADAEEIDYHAVLPTEGPMNGTGFARYTTKEDIEKLYKLDNNTITKIERQDLNLMNGKVIKEWIIELQKN